MNDPWSWVAAAVDLVFPRNCTLCSSALDEAQAGVICRGCLAGARVIEPPFCGRCGLPFDGAPSAIERCGHCHDRAFAFDRAVAACRAAGPVREAIHRFKYQRQMYFAGHLAEWIVGAAWRWIDWSEVDLVVPVPLHPRKQRQREFNQAVVLARAVGQATGCAVADGVLRRRRDTATQTHLTAPDRAKNLKGAFGAGARIGLASGQRVVLVDDVFTTGATLDGCAKVLRDGGAETITALTVARGV